MGGLEIEEGSTREGRRRREYGGQEAQGNREGDGCGLGGREEEEEYEEDGSCYKIKKKKKRTHSLTK